MKSILSIIIGIFLVIPLFGQSDEKNAPVPVQWQPLKTVNSPYDEFSPSISPDGTQLIFSSARPGGLGDNDIWMSRLVDGEWKTPVNLRSINSQWHDHEPCFSHDGNLILFSSDRNGGHGTGDLFASRRNGDRWGPPVNLGPVINSRDSEKMPSLSMDGRELFFTRIPVDYSRGRLDTARRQIFSSRLTAKGWSKPQPLPPPVNLMKLESAARIQADGRTLIFCSAREGSAGGFDLWKAVREKPGAPWGHAEPLSDLNSPASEVYFGTDIAGKTLFLASNNNPRKNFDLYVAYSDLKLADATVTLQGKVFDRTSGDPLGAKIVIEMLEGDSVEPFELQSDPENGTFSLTLPEGGRYSITAERDGFLFYSRELNLEQLQESDRVYEEIELSPLKAGEKIIFKTIYFQPNSALLLESSQPALNRLLQLMQRHTDLRIRILGHVAAVAGYDDEIQQLSLNRAKAVQAYLTKNGINPLRAEAIGMGIKQPIGDNSTESGRKLNRRTEIEVIE